MECYCVARNKPIRREITKPQTATVISLWFWGLLACPELYCDWPVHNQHSWNFSGVHSFLSLTVTKWLKIIIGLVICSCSSCGLLWFNFTFGWTRNLSIYFKQNCQTPWTSQAQNWKRVKDKEWREVTSRLKKKWIKMGERRNFFCGSPTCQFPLIFSTLFSSPCYYSHFKQVMGKSLRRIEITLNRIWAIWVGWFVKEVWF